MLGIDYKRDSSFPVGYLDYIDMYELNFEEFLWSLNVSSAIIGDFHEMFIEKTLEPEPLCGVIRQVLLHSLFCL